MLKVGPEPSFVIGVHPQITRWRLAFSFDRERLSSIFGRAQIASYQLTNTFDEGIGGRITMHMPKVWSTDLKRVQFKLAASEEFSDSFHITLRPDASSGEETVRVEFELTADRNYKFDVYRRLDVGLGDVSIEVSTHVNKEGQLVVQQQLINRTDKYANFDCMLYAPDRRRQRQQIFNLGRGRNTQTSVLPRGKELIGKTIWMRAEEIGGDRILNHRIVVEP